MIKDILIKQKKELEDILSKQYVERRKTVFAKKYIENDLVKVVIGPRRAGKSRFSKQGIMYN